MKLKLISLVVLISSIFGCLGQSNGSYTVVLVQGNVRYELTSADTLIRLKPEPFRFEIEIKDFPGVFMNAHTYDEYYNLPDTEVWESFQYLASMVPAEDAFNVNQDLYFGSTSFCYWNYKKDNDWHRFDEGLRHRGNKIEGTYTVNTLFHNESRSYRTLKDFKETLHIMFFTASFTDDWVPDFPSNRKRVRIQFI